MTTPVYPSKRYYHLGAHRATTWDTAVALGAGDGILATTDGSPELKQPYVQHEEIGMYIPTGGRLGQLGPIDFSPEADLHYDHGPLTSMIAAIYGTAGVPTIQGTSTAYKHVFSWADQVTNFFTVAVDRPGHIYEAPAFMPYKLDLKVKSGQVQATVTGKATRLIDNSTTNTATQIAAMTYADTSNEVRLGQGVLWMTTEADTNTMTSAKVIAGGVSDFEISVVRNIDAVFGVGSESILLPNEKAPTWDVKLTIPHTQSTDYDMTEFKALTSYRMWLLFTGATISGIYNYSLKLGFTRLVLKTTPAKPLADIMSTKYEFVGEASTAAPVDMTGYTRPYIELVNTRATDYLA